MKQNPFMTVFGIRKRRRVPRVTKRERSFIQGQIRKEPTGTKLRFGYRVQWRDAKGRFSSFTTRKPLRGVVEYIEPRRRMSKAERRRITEAAQKRLMARRASEARSRMVQRLKKHLTLVKLLIARSARYPARHAIYLTQRDELMSVFVAYRAVAITMSGKVVPWVRLIESEYDRLGPVLKVVPTPGVWLPASLVINGMIGPGTAYNLPAAAWDAEVDFARRQYLGVRPLNVIWVWNNDPLAHPLGSANLLIREDEYDPRLFATTVAPKWTIFALCKLPPEWDAGIEQGQLVKSPEKDLRKSPQFYKRRMPGNKYVVLGCPIVYRREMIQTPQMAARGIRPMLEPERSLRGIHSFLHGWVPQQDEKPFTGQEVWKENFQRFYWSRKKYVYPILFLGYTPRTEHRLSMAPTIAGALKEAV